MPHVWYAGLTKVRASAKSSVRMTRRGRADPFCSVLEKRAPVGFGVGRSGWAVNEEGHSHAIEP